MCLKDLEASISGQNQVDIEVDIRAGGGTPVASVGLLLASGPPVDLHGTCCSCPLGAISTDDHKLSSQARSHARHMEAPPGAAVRRILEQASIGASLCLLLDTARSPCAPAQAPRMARVAILRPSTGTGGCGEPMSNDGGLHGRARRARGRAPPLGRVWCRGLSVPV